MIMQAHNIKSAHGSRHKSKRLGRGNASGKGTMSGRGGKGQTARSGGGRRSYLRAFKPSLLKVPKLRGFHSFKPRPEIVTVATLNRIAEEGVPVTPAWLKQKSVIGSTQTGVKIIGNAEVKKKLVIEGCLASKGAVAAIEKAGGTITF